MTAPPLAAVTHDDICIVVGHVRIRIDGGDAARRAAVGELWEKLFVVGAAAATGESISVRLSAEKLALEPGNEVYAAAALQVVETVAGFFLRCGASAFAVTPGEAGRLYLAPDFWERTPYEQREFFLLGLLMLLRPRGLYGLHACGLRRGDVGALLVGSSGAGKTTTTLNLVGHGWDYLSDDAVLLRDHSGRVDALAFRKGFSCTPKMLLAFPGLDGAEEFGDPGGKRVVTLAAALGGGFVPSCTPRLLLFPRLHPGPTTLRSLPNAAALVRLSQQSGGIMTASGPANAVSRAQLELLKRLVSQTQSYDLLLGEDALHTSSLVSGLLEALA